MALLYDQKKMLRRKATETTLSDLKLPAEAVEAFRKEHDLWHQDAAAQNAYYFPVLEAWLEKQGFLVARRDFWAFYKRVSYTLLSQGADADSPVPWEPTRGDEAEIFGRVEKFGIQGEVRTMFVRDQENILRVVYLRHTALKNQVEQREVRQGDDVLIRYLGMVTPRPSAISVRARYPYHNYNVSVLE